MSVAERRAGGTIFDDWYDDLRMNEVFHTEITSLSAEDVRTFADLTGDHHPLHLDPDYGAQSIFGRNIAHGMLVLSRGMGTVPLNPERTLILRQAESVFKRPVAVDQEFYGECRLTERKPIDDHFGLVTVSFKFKALPLDGAGGKERARLAVRGAVVGLWARTPAAFDAVDLSGVGFGS
jgi:3-hydroxybutyryl-CoA dehydratase